MEYDELQNVLDNKTEENYHLLQKIEKLEREISKFDRGLGEREVNIQSMAMKIKHLEEDMEKL